MSTFDPNGVALPNGNFFALPYTLDEAEIVLLPVPWDVTTSYRPGASDAPQAIIKASGQVDLFDFDVKDAWQIKIGTYPFNDGIYSRSADLRTTAEEVILFLEQGGEEDDKYLTKRLERINDASEELNDWVRFHSLEYIDRGKLVGVVGGDHSTPLGLLKALAGKYGSFGILHIDAHADLRQAYEGFTYSHASIMYNVMDQLPNVERLVQVGVRDLCEEEQRVMENDRRIELFSDNHISSELFSGSTWQQLCERMVERLPQNVYISFDIDGLSPDLCPNTGTPVPGGLNFQQACFLLRMLATSGRRIIGFDLNEVSPDDSNEWDANVGARVLYKLCCYSHLANLQLKK